MLHTSLYYIICFNGDFHKIQKIGLILLKLYEHYFMWCVGILIQIYPFITLGKLNNIISKGLSKIFIYRTFETAESESLSFIQSSALLSYFLWNEQWEAETRFTKLPSEYSTVTRSYLKYVLQTTIMFFLFQDK